MPKIIIDAGHYGKYNRSPCIKEYYESEYMWRLQGWLRYYLERLGCTVGLVRNDQKKDMEVFQRGKSAKGNDFLISLHSNAVGSSINESVDYPVAYIPISGKVDVLGKLLAECVAKMMGTKQSAQWKTRRGNNGDYYGVIRGAAAVNVPCIILEHSFHTNTKATKWLMDDNNLQAIAKAEAEIIAEYFGVRVPKNEEINSGVQYAIQIGAYTSKSAANEVLAKIKTLGFSDAFIVEKEAINPVAPVKSVYDVALEVINGMWGNGDERKKRLTDAGYSYSEVQAQVNSILKD